MEYDLPYEGAKLSLYAVLHTTEKADVQLVRTLPIGVSTNEDERWVKDAAIEITENGNPWVNLYYKADTTFIYTIFTRFEMDSISYDTTETRIQIQHRYVSDEPLFFAPTATYQITVNAPGFPVLQSEPVVYEDITTPVLLDYTPLITNEYDERIIPSIQWNVMCAAYSRKQINLQYRFWSMAHPSINAIGYFQGGSIDVDPVIGVNYPLNHYDVTIGSQLLSGCLDTCFDQTTGQFLPDCAENCYVIADGVKVTILTYSQSLLDYQESVSNNSEYLGGFFPPNPYIAHNVNGGYGIFSLVEVDTLLIQR
ncbi:MAG: DUF4249 family protein [Saprospiraceae bacterium]